MGMVDGFAGIACLSLVATAASAATPADSSLSGGVPPDPLGLSGWRAESGPLAVNACGRNGAPALRPQPGALSPASLQSA